MRVGEEEFQIRGGSRSELREGFVIGAEIAFCFCKVACEVARNLRRRSCTGVVEVSVKIGRWVFWKTTPEDGMVDGSGTNPAPHVHQKFLNDKKGLQEVATSRMNSFKQEEETGTLLYYASKGNVPILKHMLDNGTSVNAADYDGRTALHLAASEGHVAAVKLLLEYGPNVNPTDRLNETPLADAQRYGHKEICELLEANGGFANPSAALVEYEIDPAELGLEKARPVGKGAFGEIKVVKWRGTTVAAKTILNHLTTDQKIVKEFIGELALLSKLRHPNIMQFLGAVTKSQPLVIVTEYLPKGDLHDYLDRKGRLDAVTAVKFALDIAKGMNYLHKNKPDPIVHRDLKPRNLLLHEAGYLKVADFGLGKLLDASSAQTDMYAMTGETGSYRYMAPEVFLHKAYDKSVDVFSFAIIVQELFEGGPESKFQGAKDIAHFRAKEGKRPAFTVNTYPPHMKDLLRQCWDQDPVKRPTFASIIVRLENILNDRQDKRVESSFKLFQCIGAPQEN